MCKIMKRIVPTLVCMLTALCMLTMTVSAEATYKLNVSDNALWESCAELVEASKDLGLSKTAEGVLSFDESNFVGMTDKEKKSKIKNFMRAIAEADISSNGTVAITDTLYSAESVDMSIYLTPYIVGELRGDVIGGAKIVTPFLPTINTIIGAAVIIIMALLVGYTIYDIVIIIVPALREKIVEKSGGESSKRPAYVSEAAWSSIKDAEGAIGSEKGSYKSALWLYLKRRLPEFIVMGIVLAVLLMGGVGTIMEWLLSLGSNYSG